MSQGGTSASFIPPQQGGWRFLSTVRFFCRGKGCQKPASTLGCICALSKCLEGPFVFGGSRCVPQRVPARRLGKAAVDPPSPVGAASSAHCRPPERGRQTGHGQGNTQNCCSLPYRGSASRTRRPRRSVRFYTGEQFFK